jgi:hypothetical protein
MNIRKIIAVSTLLLGTFQLAQAEELKLEYGVNTLDINADGLDDVIVKSRWENGNAHSFDRYLIMAQLKGEHNLNGFYEIPLGDRVSYSFTTSEGADCILTDYKFAKNKSGFLEVTKYARNHSESYASDEYVIITSYVFADSIKDEDFSVGFPILYLKKTNETVTDKKYCNVRDLMN